MTPVLDKWQSCIDQPIDWDKLFTIGLLAKDLHRTWNLKTSSSSVIVHFSLLCMKQLLPNLNLIIQHTIVDNVVGRGKKIWNNCLKHFFAIYAIYSSCFFSLQLVNKKFIIFLQNLLSLEKKLEATSDPGVLVEFYAPVQESLVVISKALDTLEERGTDHSTEQQHM